MTDPAAPWPAASGTGELSAPDAERDDAEEATTHGRVRRFSSQACAPDAARHGTAKPNAGHPARIPCRNPNCLAFPQAPAAGATVFKGDVP